MMKLPWVRPRIELVEPIDPVEPCAHCDEPAAYQGETEKVCVTHVLPATREECRELDA